MSDYFHHMMKHKKKIEFNFVSKQYNNAANNYAEVIFSLVNKFIKSDNK